MITRIAELEIAPDRLDDYNALLTAEIEASVRLEPGVLFLLAVAQEGSPGTIRRLEGYPDRGAYEAHLQAPHFLRYKAETAGMVRSLRLLEAVPAVLKAKLNALD